MIAAAIVCAAAMSQAASLNWGAGVYNGSAGPDCEAGQMAYLIYSDTAFSGVATKFNINDLTTDNGGTAVHQHELTSTDAHTNWKFTDAYKNADADGGVNGYYQIILLNEAGDKFAVLDAGHITGISDSTGAGNAILSMDWSKPETYLGGTGYTGIVESVPEPTSGLLLLLGVAGLALRRRRA